MTGSRQIAAFVRAHRDASTLPIERFEWAGGRVRCVLCGARGWGSPVIRDQSTFTGKPMPWWQACAPWQIPHLMDHPWPCSCGLSFRDFSGLWQHIGAPRPFGWGRQGEHAFALECEVVA